MRMQSKRLVTRKATCLTAILMVVAAASGCGGGSSGGAAPPPPSGGGDPPPPPPPPPQGANSTGGGFWGGYQTQDDEFVRYVSCLLIESGELTCEFADPDPTQPAETGARVAALHGNVQFSSTGVPSGSGRVYALPGHVLADGSSVVADFTISGGALTDHNTDIELTFASLGQETTFIGDYLGNYVEERALRVPSGVYANSDILGVPAAFTIDADGTLFLQTASGCTGNGQVMNILPDQVPGTTGYNAFNVELTLANCQELDGTYEGLANGYRLDEEIDYTALWIRIFSDTRAIVARASE